MMKTTQPALTEPKQILNLEELIEKKINAFKIYHTCMAAFRDARDNNPTETQALEKARCTAIISHGNAKAALLDLTVALDALNGGADAQENLKQTVAFSNHFVNKAPDSHTIAPPIPLAIADPPVTIKPNIDQTEQKTLFAKEEVEGSTKTLNNDTIKPSVNTLETVTEANENYTEQTNDSANIPQDLKDQQGHDDYNELLRSALEEPIHTNAQDIALGGEEWIVITYSDGTSCCD